MNQTSTYVPGVCNINPKEVAARRKVGQIGLAVTVVLGLFLIFTDFDRLIRIILFLPIFISAIGYLQAKNHFCVGYGGSGLQNAEPGSLKASAVKDDDAAVDKKRSRNLNLQAALIALIMTAIIVAVPHI
jgi:hypothetical protein